MNDGSVRWVALAVISVGLIAILAAAPGVVLAQSEERPVSFAEGSITDERGDVVTIPVELREDVNRANLRIKSTQRDYTAILRLRDGDGDGMVRVRFNTYSAVEGADPPAFGTVSAADSVSVVSQWSTQDLPVLEAGRYNMIAVADGYRVAATLRLEEPKVGSSSSSAIPVNEGVDGVVDGGSFSTEMVSTTDSDGSSGTTAVAQGDVVRIEFDVKGVSGALTEDPPGRDLVVPDDSSPGVETTHLLQLQLDRPVEGVRSMRIDYDEGNAPTFRRAPTGGIETLGVDETGNGEVDRSLKHAVQGVRVTSGGELTVGFDREMSFDVGETVLARYRVVNPRQAGVFDLSLELSDEVGNVSNPEADGSGGLRGEDDEPMTTMEIGTESDPTDEVSSHPPTEGIARTGIVRYGEAGHGTLGNGIDLRVGRFSEEFVVSPIASVQDVRSDAEDRLIVFVDAGRFEPGFYEATLTIEDQPHLEKEVVLRERFSVEEPVASLSGPTVSANGSAVTYNVETNYAPGKLVNVEIRGSSNGDDAFLYRCMSSVGSDGTTSCTYRHGRSLSGISLDTSVFINDEELDGPIRTELP